ncbi:MAG: hypothetical protein LBH55_01360 [Mycoplasmataceae bacterium]|jgi:hypothetical protein|nr:hypothetical protein [Mycoplasmataceae bacterium]
MKLAILKNNPNVVFLNENDLRSLSEYYEILIEKSDVVKHYITNNHIKIVSREEALKADIILTYNLKTNDFKHISKEAKIISFFNFINKPEELIKYLKFSLNTVGLELFPPFVHYLNNIKINKIFSLLDKNSTVAINDSAMSRELKKCDNNITIIHDDKYTTLLKSLSGFKYIIYTSDNNISKTKFVFTKKIIYTLDSDATIINLNSNLGFSSVFFNKTVNDVKKLPKLYGRKYIEINEYMPVVINNDISATITDFLIKKHYTEPEMFLTKNGKIVNKDLNNAVFNKD